MIHPTEANILYKTSPKSRPRSPIPLWSETFRRICSLPTKEKLLKYPEPFNEQTKEHCLQIDSVEFFERINVVQIEKETRKPKNDNQGGEDHHATLSVKNSIEEETLEWAKTLKPTPNVVLHKSREFSIRLKFYRSYDESVDKIGFYLEPETDSTKEKQLYKMKCELQNSDDDKLEDPYREMRSRGSSLDSGRQSDVWKRPDIQAFLVEKDANVLIIDIRLPAQMPTGFWQMGIYTSLNQATLDRQKQHQQRPSLIGKTLEIPKQTVHEEKMQQNIDNVSIIDHLYIV